jgi:hypothetical protein
VVTPDNAAWPSLPLDAWADTYATLHMWLQIVGKIRLRCSPPINHQWHSTLYVTARGLTTSPLSFNNQVFEIEFDFYAHQLTILSSDGRRGVVALNPQPVAVFYRDVMNALSRLELPVTINAKPNEVADPIRFEDDEVHRSYDKEYANRFSRVLQQTDRVFKRFRSRFIGKCSPVHLFWGAPDLAVTRFSGRTAPQHPGGIPNMPDAITREAYSHEVSSCGFWPGGGPVPYPVFYAYAYPEPAGFADARVTPAAAFYSRDLHEFLLPYDAVRTAASPDEVLLEFLQSTYDAAADLAHWDRRALERGAPV